MFRVFAIFLSQILIAALVFAGGTQAFAQSFMKSAMVKKGVFMAPDDTGFANCERPTGAGVALNDFRCLVCNCVRESGNEPFEGQVAVVESVLARMTSGEISWGGPTPCGVVYAPGQYSWTSHRDLRQMPVKTGHSCFAAVRKALDENGPFCPQYHAEYVCPKWPSNVEFVKQIGAHLFFWNTNEGRNPFPPAREPACRAPKKEASSGKTSKRSSSSSSSSSRRKRRSAK